MCIANVVEIRNVTTKTIFRDYSNVVRYGGELSQKMDSLR